MANHVVVGAPGVRFAPEQEGDNRGIITERTPFLVGYPEASHNISDNSQSVYIPLTSQHLTSSLSSSQQTGVYSQTSHLFDATSDYTASCLSYYDPYHDMTYAAHYLLPVKPLLGGTVDDSAEYDTSGSLSGSSVPVVSPGAISTYYAPGNGQQGNKSPARQPHTESRHKQNYSPGSKRRQKGASSESNSTGGVSQNVHGKYNDADPEHDRHGYDGNSANMDIYPDNEVYDYSTGDAEQDVLSRNIRCDEQSYQIENEETSPGHLPTATEMPPGYLPGLGVLQQALTPNWKVDYMDFTPEMSGFECGNICCEESFPDLVNRVNYWLTQNPHVEAKTCEMVTWSTSELPQVGDSESMVQARHCEHSLGQDTFNVMGLRLWIVPKTGSGPAQTLGYRDYKSYEGERISQLTQKANCDLEENPIHGNIISFETVMVPNFRSWNTSRLFWRDSQPEVEDPFNVFLRLYYVSGVKTLHRLGIRNIVPEVVRGNHEPFSYLMRRASQWVSSEPGVKVTNLRSTYVSKNNDSPSLAADRCSHYFRDFTKHQYYQLLRIFYLCCPNQINSPDQKKHIINCMTFTPVQSSLGTNVQAMFERMKPTMLRIGAWIRLSGAKIFSLESVMTPMMPNQPNHTLPEMTYWTPSSTSGAESHRKFLVHIRIYIDGEFMDPDPRLLPPLPYSLTKELQNSIEEKELKRFYKKKKMRKTQNRIAIATFMFILVTVALVIIIERIFQKYYH